MRIYVVPFRFVKHKLTNLRQKNMYSTPIQYKVEPSGYDE